MTDQATDKKARRRAYLAEYEKRPERIAYRQARERERGETRLAQERAKRLVKKEAKGGESIRVELTIRFLSDDRAVTRQALIDAASLPPLFARAGVKWEPSLLLEKSLRQQRIEAEHPIREAEPE